MRYTKPVRFIYSGNKHAAMGMRGHARTLIGKTLNNPVGKKLGRKQNLGRFKYTNGVQFTVQRTFGVINCYIHVPTGEERLDRIQKGFIVYYDIGRLFPEHNNHDGLSVPTTQNDFEHWPKYRKYGLHAFKPPYADTNGNPIVDSSGNFGNIHLEAYVIRPDGPWPPGHPILLESKVTNLAKPQKWKGYRFTKDEDNNNYEPSSPLVDWEALSGNEADSYWEANTESTTVWSSPDTYPEQFVVWWKYTDGGDLHFVDSNEMDWGDFVYVNGVKYLVPYQYKAGTGAWGGVRSAAVQWHQETNTYWLVVTTLPENKITRYIEPSIRGTIIYTLQLVKGTKPTKDFEQSNNYFIPSDVTGDEATIKEYSKQWFVMDNAYNGIKLPAVGTNEATWTANGDIAEYFWDAVGFKFNQDATKFAISNWIEYAFSTEVNEFNITVTPTIHEYAEGARVYYTPVITSSLNYSDYGTLNRSNAVADSTWHSLNSGPITCGLNYVDNVLTKITITPEVNLTKSPSGQEYLIVSHRTTISDGTTNYVRNSNRTKVETGSDPDYIMTTTALHHDGSNPVHWDLAEDDLVLETVDLQQTGFDPAETTTIGTYTKTITVGGFLASTDTGNWTRVTNTSYPEDPPEGLPQYWAYGVDRLDVDGDDFRWTTEGAVSIFGIDADLVATKYAWWYYRGYPTGSLEVHRGDPVGRMIGNLIPRSMNARNSGFYLVETPDQDKQPWNWLTDQDAFITGGDDVKTLLKVYTDEHTYTNSIKPIVRVQYYGTKPIRTKLE